jgi:hypothetical protein
MVLSQPRYAQNLAGVIGGRFVKHNVLDGDQQLVVSASEAPGQRLVAGLHYHAFTNHVPELLLRYPILFAVVADDQGGFFNFHIQGASAGLP